MKKILLFVIIVAVIALCCTSFSYADVKQMKVYKEAYPETKADCMICHVDKMPKKDDGKHELNAYGKKAKEMAEEPTADTYKELGNSADFKEEAGQ